MHLLYTSLAVLSVPYRTRLAVSIQCKIRRKSRLNAAFGYENVYLHRFSSVWHPARGYLGLRAWCTYLADRDIDAFFSAFRNPKEQNFSKEFKFLSQEPSKVMSIISRNSEAIKNFSYETTTPELTLALNQTEIGVSWNFNITFSRHSGHWYPAFFDEYKQPDKALQRTSCASTPSRTSHRFTTVFLSIYITPEHGCLDRYAHRLQEATDPDFLFFISIDSETDHLPIGVWREGWAEDSLTRKDNEVHDIEEFYREAAQLAAKSVLNKVNTAEQN